ncbi:MAG: hypothetical protein WDM89_16855 [Rhizomicrobium sp.]
MRIELAVRHALLLNQGHIAGGDAVDHIVAVPVEKLAEGFDDLAGVLIERLDRRRGGEYAVIAGAVDVEAENLTVLGGQHGAQPDSAACLVRAISLRRHAKNHADRERRDKTDVLQNALRQSDYSFRRTDTFIYSMTGTLRRIYIAPAKTHEIRHANR